MRNIQHPIYTTKNLETRESGNPNPKQPKKSEKLTRKIETRNERRVSLKPLTKNLKHWTKS